MNPTIPTWVQKVTDRQAGSTETGTYFSKVTDTISDLSKARRAIAVFYSALHGRYSIVDYVGENLNDEHMAKAIRNGLDLDENWGLVQSWQADCPF